MAEGEKKDLKDKKVKKKKENELERKKKVIFQIAVTCHISGYELRTISFVWFF